MTANISDLITDTAVGILWSEPVALRLGGAGIFGWTMRLTLIVVGTAVYFGLAAHGPERPRRSKLFRS